MPNLEVTDPRLKDIGQMVRSERRAAVWLLLYLAAILLLFALIGFIPGSLNDHAEDLCLRTFGHVDSELIAYGALIFALLVQVPILGTVALAVRFRRSAHSQQPDRLELLRKQLLAEGIAPHRLGIWTEADWSRCFRRMGIVCALLTATACAALYGISKRHQLDGKPVRISATARLDLAFRTAQHSSSSGMRGGTTMNIFRLDRYGFQPTVRGSGYRDTLFVPLADAAWRPGQPFELFYQCDSLCAFGVPAGSPLLPANIIVSGRLQRSQLPFFVKRTFERAGIPLASPYYVLTDHEQQPADVVAPAAYVGILVTAVLFGLSVLYRKITPPARKEDMIKTTEPPMITFTVDRESVCMADDMESHASTMSVAPLSPVVEVLREALKVCPPASVSEMTWIVKTVGAESRSKRLIAVLAAKWREPKLLVSEHETAASLFQDGAAGLYFWYRQQSDPEADYLALKNTARVPQREKTST